MTESSAPNPDRQPLIAGLVIVAAIAVIGLVATPASPAVIGRHQPVAVGVGHRRTDGQRPCFSDSDCDRRAIADSVGERGTERHVVPDCGADALSDRSIAHAVGVPHLDASSSVPVVIVRPGRRRWAANDRHSAAAGRPAAGALDPEGRHHALALALGPCL